MLMHQDYSWQRRVSVPSQCGRNCQFPGASISDDNTSKQRKMRDVGSAGKAALSKVRVLPVEKFIFFVCFLLELSEVEVCVVNLSLRFYCHVCCLLLCGALL